MHSTNRCTVIRIHSLHMVFCRQSLLMQYTCIHTHAILKALFVAAGSHHEAVNWLIQYQVRARSELGLLVDKLSLPTTFVFLSHIIQSPPAHPSPTAPAHHQRTVGHGPASGWFGCFSSSHTLFIFMYALHVPLQAPHKL